MKKLVVMAIAALMAMSVNAGTGSIVVSGNFGLDITAAPSVDGEKNGTATTSFELAPSLTYFLSDNFGVGGQIGYASDSKNVYNNGDKNKDASESTSFFTIEPFARYYFLNGEKFKFFGQAGLEFGAGTNITTVTLGVKPGVQYIVNEKFSVELSLGNIFSIANRTDTKENPTGKDIKTSQTTAGFFINNPRYAEANPYSLGFAPLSFTINYHLK
ncbi:MAG: porin family protein [Prevotellaceae bacterium]|jgi:hypothetical protein|nr:porin family protein [Prevotellaceae bacterium]